LEIRENEFDKAQTFYLQARDLYVQERDKTGLACVFVELGRIALEKGRVEEAYSYLEKSWQTTLQSNLPDVADYVAYWTDEILEKTSMSGIKNNLKRQQLVFKMYARFNLLTKLSKVALKVFEQLATEANLAELVYWQGVWRELGENHDEFQIPLRLMNAAVQFLKSNRNKRALLELPIEERRIVQNWFGK
jgi:hypothetical protein